MFKKYLGTSLLRVLLNNFYTFRNDLIPRNGIKLAINIMRKIIFIAIPFVLLCCSAVTTQKKQTLADLIKQGRPVVIENRTFEKPIDFIEMLSSAAINEKSGVVDIYSSITFVNCRFTQEVAASKKVDNGTISTLFHSSLKFINCDFEQKINFRGVSVFGKVNFTKSVFREIADFEDCTFMNKVYFNQARFDQELKFQNSVFQQLANFLDVEFNETSSFQKAQFRDEAFFGNANFYGYADFSLTQFRDNAIFNYAEFHDRAIFSNSRANKRFEMNSTSHKETTIRGYEFFGETKWDENIEGVIFENNFYLFPRVKK